MMRFRIKEGGRQRRRIVQRALPWVWLLITCTFLSVTATAQEADAPGSQATTPLPPERGLSIVESYYYNLLQRDEYKQQVKPDFFEQVGHWIVTALQSLQESFSKYEYSAQLIRLSYALMWTILILSFGALLYWGVKLLRWRYSFDELITEKPTGRPFLAPPESFDVEIRTAVSSRQWAGALVLSWRRFLSLLERRELVAADRTRTNWEYLAQLEQLDPQLLPVTARESCRKLIRAYDRYIYGAETVSQEEWTRWDEALQVVARELQLEVGVRV